MKRLIVITCGIFLAIGAASSTKACDDDKMIRLMKEKVQAEKDQAKALERQNRMMKEEFRRRDRIDRARH